MEETNFSFYTPMPESSVAVLAGMADILDQGDDMVYLDDEIVDENKDAAACSLIPSPESGGAKPVVDSTINQPSVLSPIPEEKECECMEKSPLGIKKPP